MLSDDISLSSESAWQHKIKITAKSSFTGDKKNAEHVSV